MSTTSSSSSNRNPIIYGIAGVAGVIVLVLVLTFTVFIPQGVKSQGNQKEASLSASYANGATYLSNCVVKTKQSANVANAQTAALDKVLKDAVAGRYGTGNTMDKAKLFSAIVEAYPETNGLSKTFQDVLATITGCQDDFRNYQTVVQDKVRDFNAWRTGSWKVRTFGGSGFPNENLYVRLPGVSLTAADAYEKISQPIVDATTTSAYQSGEQQLDNPFGTPTP
jgi:hypothetical protein